MPTVRNESVYDMAEVVMKTCSRCKQRKELSNFDKRKDRKIGVQSHCKLCQKLRKSEYRATPEGKEKTRLYAAEKYSRDKGEILKANKEWREENKERRAVYLAEYESTRRVRTKEDLRRYSRSYCNKRYATDAKFRLERKISSGIRRSLGSRKNGHKWEEMVDFTYKELVARLKVTLPDGYLWEDYESGATDLEIDHIIPLSVFNYRSHKHIDFKKCWDLQNLMLMPKAENRAKSNNLREPFQPCLRF